jgi:hypothetical protein
MTTEQTTNEETPKKRIPVKTKKRIDELEAQHASLIAEEKTILASLVRTSIERLQQGLSETPPDDGVTESEGTGEPVDLVEGKLGVGYAITAEGLRDLTPEETEELHAAQPAQLTAVDAAPIACPSCFVAHPEPHHTMLVCANCDHAWKNPQRRSQADVTWNDVVAASAERAANEWEWEDSEEVIPVTLTSADKARLIDENGVDQKEKDAVDKKIDEHKERIKALKAEADVILARTEDRNRAASRGIEDRRATWKVGTCFAINTVRYVDRETGLVVRERPIEAHERQIALPLVSDDAAAKAAQLSLGDVEPGDDTAMTDPEALLDAAQKGETEPADQPLDNDGSSEDLGDDEDGDADDSDEEDES